MTDLQLITLIDRIVDTSQFFRQQAQKQVNVMLTLRNWCIGYYLVEYEQQGADRAIYGDNTLEQIAVALKQQGLKGLGKTNLKIFRQFYLNYPQIGQTLSDQSSQFLLPQHLVFRNISVKSETQDILYQIAPLTLVNQLSFSHFIELLKIENPLQRSFYESQTIKNHWSVRELQRAINSLLFERTGLSLDKEKVLEKHAKGTGLSAKDVFRNPYMLEFLGLQEKIEYYILSLNRIAGNMTDQQGNVVKIVDLRL
ncbi:hypothetical protein GCM10023206_01060 [Acinetobacter puyangensis]|uniref:YhcG N-terminal domain-containing protein n=1 Tax=Acinetobacter puyangensis TaxID=1096779 RepID=A0A240E723_9GAMM|nr:DUF1016 N-terminal domain-containing protein [Acinetobacter puyangensis]SNX44544.1 Protein of unknown function [Acinetobacter puyangensis]